MTGPIIAFEGVGKVYSMYHHVQRGLKGFLVALPTAVREMRSQSYEALRDVSFAIDRGETVGVVGRNGAGKSTLLALIAGVLRPTTGRVAVGGRVAPLLELGAGFNPELSGLDNIVMNGIILGMTRKTVLQRLDDIVAFAELEEFIDQPIRTYSRGMVARLGFAVVAFMDAEILLIDEVLAVGDMDFKSKCMDRIMKFKREGVTIVFVSHALDDIARICDRAMWIGRYFSPQTPSLRRIGLPRAVLDEYIAATAPGATTPVAAKEALGRRRAE